PLRISRLLISSESNQQVFITIAVKITKNRSGIFQVYLLLKIIWNILFKAPVSLLNVNTSLRSLRCTDVKILQTITIYITRSHKGIFCGKHLQHEPLSVEIDKLIFPVLRYRIEQG